MIGGGQQVVVEVLLEELGGVVVVLDGLLGVDLHDDVVLAGGEHVVAIHQERANVAAAVGGHDAHVGVHASFLGARLDESLVLLVRGRGHQVVAVGQDAQAVEDLVGHVGVEDVCDREDLQGSGGVQGGLVGARGDDGRQARVRHEVTRTRGARQVREDQVRVVAGLFRKFQHVRANDRVAVQVERVVEEIAALEDRAAVREQHRGVVEDGVTRGVVLARVGHDVRVAEVAEVLREARLVPLDRVVVGADRGHLVPVLAEVRGAEQRVAHGDPVGLNVARHAGGCQEGVGAHLVVFGDAPEVHRSGGIHAVEEVLPRVDGREEGVVEEDQLVDLAEAVPAEAGDAVAVAAHVEAGVFALEDLGGALEKALTSGVVQRRVGDDEDLIEVLAQRGQALHDVVVDEALGIKEQENTGALHGLTPPCRRRWPGSGGSSWRRPTRRANRRDDLGRPRTRG